MVGEKYIAAVRDAVGAVPLLIPVLEKPIDPTEVLSAVDGLLFTGSHSNVAPHRYGGAHPREGVLQDERRDTTALPLLSAAIDRGMPTLCICRGFQELNVALGGTLHQHVEEVPGRIDHRASPDASIDQQYGPAHEVLISEGGMLAKLSRERAAKVNSLHSQGIDQLAPSLFVEARAPDQTIEAVSLPTSKGFLLGVQWHPEWNWVNDPVSKALFFAFRDAVRESASASL
jgi:putative glutamine amidotransferase